MNKFDVFDQYEDTPFIRDNFVDLSYCFKTVAYCFMLCVFKNSRCQFHERWFLTCGMLAHSLNKKRFEKRLSCMVYQAKL